MKAAYGRLSSFGDHKMDKLNKRPNGTVGDTKMPDAGVSTGVTTTYGGGLDKGYQNRKDISGDCLSDKPAKDKK